MTEPKKKNTLIKSLLLLAGNAGALTWIYTYLSGKEPEGGTIKIPKEIISAGAKFVELAKTRVTDWSITIVVNGKSFSFSSPEILISGSALSFFLVVLVQVVIDKQPWNSLFTKQLASYMLIAFGAIALLAFVALNWLTAVNPAVLVIGGTALGYLIFRLTQRFAGKPVKLP